ncbi:MAG: serine O-acetyltransferase [Planctomycetota bacterium]|jgi:serine O-acetyltransferase
MTSESTHPDLGGDPERPSVEGLAEDILESYASDERTSHIDAGALPNRARGIELLELLRDLIFPGYFSEYRLTQQNVRAHVERRIADIRELMETEVGEALAYQHKVGIGLGAEPGDATVKARHVTDAFLERIPELRRYLATDVQAAYDGDPASINTDETIFCYPGVDAIFTYRIAHEIHKLGLPLLARILSEYVHNETGIDLHPGATIGESFFIDHGTGVVVGATTVIGDRVKLYQGVTLGAMSFPKDEAGRLIRSTKRHPTIEDDVTVYANATILGGNTIIGHGSIIGGSVFLTKSVPPNHYVTLKNQDLRYRSADTHDRIIKTGDVE